jgi:amino acid adenylation domain-containing protein/thioester reductase-like protein
LKRAPLVQLRIAAGPDGLWYALLRFHHIVDDATSMKMLIAEIVGSLECRVTQPADGVPYRVHVATALSYAKLREAETFFQAKLGGIEEPTAPFGLTDVHGTATQVRDARVTLPPLLVQRIHVQARRAGVSAATVFHAAWSLVVASTSGRHDVVFGTVLLGRMHGAGISRTMGMFINTLPLRLQLQSISAKELVQQTQRALIELMSHEYAPLFVAQRCSGIVGSAPLFTALLNYRHNVGAADARWSAASGIQVVAKSERTNYPITLSIDDLGGGFLLTAHTDYRIDPARVVEYLSVAVDSLTAALEQTPDTGALALSVLPQTERHLVMQAFNATQAPLTEERLVHSMFEQQAALTSEATAIIHDGRSFTYGELNARANQIARLLEARGVRRGDCVGVCLERGYDMVVAVLAALKAGACYLPLDPNYPADRLEYMLTDAAPKILITQTKLETLLPAGAVELVVVDEEQQSIASYPDANAIPAAEELAGAGPLYVIYTSGSTGKPKGTEMPHRAIVNLLQWHKRYLPCATGQRVLQFAALSFDVASQEIFSTLCTGGTLVLIDESVRRDPVALLEVINRESVQRLFLPPLMLQSLAETCSAVGAPTTLRQIVTAGEQLRVTPEVVELFERLDGCELHNHYGPTETHVVTSLTLSGDPRAWPSLPSIGKPIDNTQIYILNPARLPVPMGIAGEIFIGGANLANGYLNRPELTAERFIRNPFSDEPGSRLYRTGDLGKWREDGSIEYLGRNDQQVKIRGYRIELGEVEAQLARLPDLKEVAVVAREDAPGQKRLVGYVTQDTSGETVRPEKLRTALKAALPEYMVPNAFVILERMPVTPSGKLDRRSLPLPGGAALDTQYEAPQGTIESTLATIWQELLHIEAVGRNDNFFELGTHSILVLKALSMINKKFSCALRIQELYANPTIRELAQRIAGGEAQEEYVDLMQESALDEDIAACPGEPCIPPRTVLLTGATGFIGRYLLAQLLRDTSATVYCLVRAESYGAARSRLKEGLARSELWRPEYESRVITVHGDLRLPHLGIEAATYEVLSKTVDSIYHCATSMNHLETYSMAKRANVDSVRSIIRFAAQSRPKLINYISTLGVFGGMGPRVVDEDSSIDRERHKKASGYVASKWVAEKIVMRAGERGIHCKIFRVGLAWADSMRGHYDEAQREHRILKSSLLMGIGIKDYHYGMVPTPVDFIARAIVLLSNRSAEQLQVFHVASDAQVVRPFERLNMSGAVRLKLVPFYEWTREVKRRYEQGEALPIVPLIEHLFSMNAETFEEYQKRVRSEGVIHSCEETYEQLRKLGLAPAAVDDAALVAAARRIIRTEPGIPAHREPLSSNPELEAEGTDA